MRKPAPVIAPIHIAPSSVADTRTCDYTQVTQAQLLAASQQHIADVRIALLRFRDYITETAARHDADKVDDIAGFHRDFVTGFAQTTWWDNHRRIWRHHLAQADGVPEDVNLLDVLEYIADCVMAGMGRSGTVYPLAMSDDLLRRAFENTVSLLQSSVVVSSTGDPNA